MKFVKEKRIIQGDIRKSVNNKVNLKINGLVVLRDLKFVKEKRIIRDDVRKSVNNRVNLKIYGLVDLRDLKFVKEKRIIQGDARKSVNVRKSFISNSRIMDITLPLASYAAVIKKRLLKL